MVKQTHNAAFSSVAPGITLMLTEMQYNQMKNTTENYVKFNIRRGSMIRLNILISSVT